MNVQIIHRQSFTERLFFTSKPDQATRAALRLAGWHWDRSGNWWRNSQETKPIKPKRLAELLAAQTPDAPVVEQLEPSAN